MAVYTKSKESRYGAVNWTQLSRPTLCWSKVNTQFFCLLLFVCFVVLIRGN